MELQGAGPVSPITRLAVSTDGKRIAAAALGTDEVHVWEAESKGTEKWLLALPDNTRIGCAALAFSPKGDLLAVGGPVGKRNKITLWNTATRKLEGTAITQSLDIRALAFSPDGKWLATNGNGGGMVWDARARKERVKLPPSEYDEPGGARPVAYSPDGKLIAAAGHYGVWIHDAKTGKPIDPVGGAKVEYTGVAFTPDSRGLVSMASDGAVQFWRTE